MNETSIVHETGICVAGGPSTGAAPGDTCPSQNVGDKERLVSVMAGSALVLAGLARTRLGSLFLALSGGMFLHRGITGHCRGYEALGIDTSDRDGTPGMRPRTGVKVEKTITVACPAEDLYAFWRNVENLPRVMQHLERVEALDGNRSRWTAKGPAGNTIQWEAEIFNERDPELIAWRSLPGGNLQTAGSVHFKPLGHDRGTAVSISLKYDPPAGKLGATIARLLGAGLEEALDRDIRRFQSAMEAGEVPTIAEQPHGARR